MMSRLTVLLALLLASSLFFAACAGKSSRYSAPTSTEMAPASADVEAADADGDSAYDDPRETIAALDHEIRQWRVGGGMTAEPRTELVTATQDASVAGIRTAAGTPPEPRSEQCIDTCSIKKNICSNAESICRIAEDLATDLWATGKCDSAKGSCKEATDQCGSCVTAENGG